MREVREVILLVTSKGERVIEVMNDWMLFKLEVKSIKRVLELLLLYSEPHWRLIHKQLCCRLLDCTVVFTQRRGVPVFF